MTWSVRGLAGFLASVAALRPPPAFLAALAVCLGLWCCWVEVLLLLDEVEWVFCGVVNVADAVDGAATVGGATGTKADRLSVSLSRK